MAKKVEQLPAQATPAADALIVISEGGVSKASTIAQITGNALSLITALTTTVNGKVTANAPITGATRTKITYDANGLVTAGANATTADINDSADRRYVTDSQLASLGVIDDPYAQPPIPFKNQGLPFKVVDAQITTKFIAWNFLSAAQKNAVLDEVVATGATHVALAVPYERLAIYTDWVARARAKGLLVWHRSHRGSWEGSDSVGTASTVTRSGTTATFTATTDHGLVTGDKVWITGATPSAYNTTTTPVTVTVLDSTRFTYQVSGSPSTPATGTIKFRIDWESYRTYVVNFIVNNPTLFRAGDIFGMCVEASNADGQAGTPNSSFRTGGVFDIAKYNQAQLDQVFYANQAFATIGLKRKVYTWGISINVSLINLNGIAWNNTTGNASGLGYRDIIDKFGGVLVIDHYQSDSILDAETYRTAVRADLSNFKKSFPGCYYFAGEWGYHTTTPVTEQNQSDVTKAVIEEHLKVPEVIGFNLWVQYGSTTTSYWTDVDGGIVPGGKLAVRAAVIPAFNKQKTYTPWLSEGAQFALREKVNYTGSHMHAFITDNDDQNRADISFEPVQSKVIRTNYIPNPSFENTTLLTGWSIYGNADTRERSTSFAQFGSASFRINNATPKDGGIVSSPMVLPAGTYTLSVYRKLSAAVDNANVVARVYQGDGNPLGSAITTGYPGNTNFNRVEYSFTLAVQTNVEVLLGMGSYGSASDGETYYDGVMLEKVASAGTYFDGDTVDTAEKIYSWSGADKNSASQELTLKKLIDSNNDLMLGNPGAVLNPVLTTDGDYQGVTNRGTLGEAVSFGMLVYLDNDKKWRKAGSALSDSYDKKLGICVLGGANDAATIILIHGVVRADAQFPTFSMAGAPVFMANTLGAISTTKPSTGNVWRTIGYAEDSDILYFQPDGYFAAAS